MSKKSAKKVRKKSKEFEIVLDEDKTIGLYIRRPSQKELFQMDKVQRIAMTELLAAGVASSHKLGKILEENGEWTRQDENDIHNYAKMIAAHSKALREDHQNHPDEENRATAQRIMEWRAKHMELIGRKYDLFEACAERQADQQKMHVFARLCCYKVSDDKPFFEDEDEYNEFLEENPMTVSEIITMVYAFDHGTDEEEFGKDWAEIEYLVKKAEEKTSEEKTEEDDELESNLQEISEDDSTQEVESETPEELEESAEAEGSKVVETEGDSPQVEKPE